MTDQTNKDLQALKAVRDEIGQWISDPMWADHAELPKTTLKHWHHVLHAALSASAPAADQEAYEQECLNMTAEGIKYWKDKYEALAATNAPAAADAKAAYIRAFGSDEGWFGEPGSWFIEGFRAKGAPAAGSVPSTPEQIISFIGCNFGSMEADDWTEELPQEPIGDLSNVRYSLSVHDLLSAFSEWSDSALLAQYGSPARWIPVSEQLPASGITVLASYTNRCGNIRRIRAKWVAAKNVESTPDSDFVEYDEETDTYYDPQGWYEQIDNWPDYSAVAVVEGEVTHWMPLPPAPQEGK